MAAHPADATAASSPTALPEPPFSPAVAEEMLRRLGKTLRTRLLYLPNNPIYRGAIDGLREALTAVWAEADDFTMLVTESELRWEGRVLVSEPSRQESLPWLLYKDGVRELTLLEGVEGDELEVLLDILVRARKAAPDEDDLLTLLWEREFLYLRYRFVDLSLDGASIEAPELQDSPRNVGDLRKEAEDEPPQPAGIVSMEDLDTSLYFLEEHEIDYLRSEVAGEYQGGHQKNALSVLLDVFESRCEPDVRTEVGTFLETLVPQLLSTGEYGAVAYLLREAREMLQRIPDVPDEARAVMGRLPQRLSSQEVLPQIIRALDEGDRIPPQEELDALFAELEGNTLAIVLGAIGEAQNPQLRSALETAGTRLAAVNTAGLVELIVAPTTAVALEAVRRAGALATAAAVAPLSKVLESGEKSLRQAAAQALSDIGSPGAMRVLEQAMGDSDREIRVTAARAIGTRLYRAALPKVEAAIQGRVVKDANLTEKMVLFETYAALAGAAGVPLLAGLLHPQTGFFARKVDVEVRACAALALGRIGTPDAVAQLQAAAGDKEVLVRNSVTKALRGGEV